MIADSSNNGCSARIIPFEFKTTEYPELQERAIEVLYSMVLNEEIIKC